MSHSQDIFKNADAFFKKHFVKTEYIKRSSFLRVIKSLNYYIYVSNDKRKKAKATKLRLQILATIPADAFYVLKISKEFYKIYVYNIDKHEIRIKMPRQIKTAIADHEIKMFITSEDVYDFKAQEEYLKENSYKSIMQNISCFIETDSKKIFSLKVIEFMLKIWKNRRAKENCCYKYDFIYDESKEEYYNSKETA